jgi:protein-disulfide isomerase
VALEQLDDLVPRGLGMRAHGAPFGGTLPSKLVARPNALAPCPGGVYRQGVTPRLLTIVVRTALLAAAVASAALFVDYRQGVAPAFCGVRSGCAEVRASGFAQVLGVGLPTLGLGAFLGLFALAVWTSGGRAARVLALLCGVAGLGALALIAVQLFVVRAVCSWCMIVDGAAVLAALAALGLARAAPHPEGAGPRFVWAGVAVAAVATPVFWGEPARALEVPEAVLRLHVPGKLNIVKFTDFQCPFCRLMHPVIESVREQHDGRVHVVRVMVPLPSHPGAGPAALAYQCAPEDRREALAERLYDAEPAELTPAGVRELARAVGLEPARFDACLADERTAALVSDQMKSFVAAGLEALPATFVQSELVLGADEEKFRAAVERALAGSRSAHIGWMFALLGLLIGVAAAASWRSADEATAR